MKIKNFWGDLTGISAKEKAQIYSRRTGTETHHTLQAL